MKSNVAKTKAKYAENKAEKAKIKEEKKAVQKQLEVKAEPYTSSETKVKTDNSTEIIQPLDFEDQSLFEPVNIKRNFKNRLYGDYDPSRPPLRGYDRL